MNFVKLRWKNTDEFHWINDDEIASLTPVPFPSEEAQTQVILKTPVVIHQGNANEWDETINFITAEPINSIVMQLNR